MTELEQNLRSIKNEKDTKILPENIKEGVQIFDVIGTYRGEPVEPTDIYTTQDYTLRESNTMDETPYTDLVFTNGWVIPASIIPDLQGYNYLALYYYSNTVGNYIKLLAVPKPYELYCYNDYGSADGWFKARDLVGNNYNNILYFKANSEHLDNNNKRVISWWQQGVESYEVWFGASAQTYISTQDIYYNNTKKYRRTEPEINTYRYLKIDTTPDSAFSLDTSSHYVVNLTQTEFGGQLGIKAENIKKDTYILGIRGTFEGSISEEEYQEDLDLANDILGID